jgi:glycosyltransferase involved in cell wall biosynthesis
MELHGSSHTANGRGQRVAICVTTYRRPQGLERLFEAVDRLEFPNGAPELRLVVIDNDPEESARRVCDATRTWLDVPLHYGVEKRRGIPQARNAAIAAAVDWADWLAFLDDDEIPEAGWLDELLWAASAHDAPVVTGPSLPHFLDEPAPWIEAGGFFLRPRHATGERLPEAFTNNVLISSAVLTSMSSWFDEGMALSGGSDVEFFRRVATAGHAIVWADDAVVRECVPASRLNLRWILARAYRTGAAGAYILRKHRPGLRSSVSLLAHGGYCLAKAAVLLLAAPRRGRAAAAAALRLASYGAGRLGGLLGLQYAEYRRVHGK